MSEDTLLILQDSPAFGGHEAMFLQLLPGLLDSGRYRRIVLRHPQENTTFATKLAPFAAPDFEARGWSHMKRRAEPYLAGLRRQYAGAVRALIAAERPSALLLLQGRIENCAVPMLAAPSRLFVASYLPMAHDMASIGKKSFPGDAVRRRLYRRPNRFIVPGAAIASQLRAVGVRAPVAIVGNVVAPPPKPDRASARAIAGVANDGPVALLLGRLDVRQKGIDTLATTMRAQADALTGWTLLVAGDGEGRPLIEQLARDLVNRVDVRFLGWTDTPHPYLAAADVLLMPSRWEGVPLTMLEAFAYGIPILGSDIDVFREHLPAAHRIDFERTDLAAAMRAAAGDGSTIPIGYHQDLDRSRARFAAALNPQEAANGTT